MNLPWQLRLAMRVAPSSDYVQRGLGHQIDHIRAASPIKLNLGCGEHPMDGFVNIDLYSERADEKLDVTDLSTYQAGSVDLIENHHLFEHFSFDDACRALAEWRRVLRPGGRMILTCPNLTHVARLWLSQTLKISLGFHADRSYTERMLYGPQTNPGMFHRAGYDQHSLRVLVERAGFVAQLFHTPFPIRPTPSMLLVAQRKT